MKRREMFQHKNWTSLNWDSFQSNVTHLLTFGTSVFVLGSKKCVRETANKHEKEFGEKRPN